MSQPTAATQPQWCWDADLRKWYWYDERTDTITYQDGQRIARPSRIPRTPFPSAASRAAVNPSQFAGSSRNSGNSGNYSTASSAQVTPGGSMSPSSISPTSSHHAQPQPNRRPSVSVDSVTREFARTGIQNQAPRSSPPQQEYHAGPLQPRISANPTNGQVVTFVQDDQTGVRTVFQTEPQREYTDPVLWQSGIRSYRNLVAPDGNENEQLFPGFKKRDSPKKFFTVGKVFLVLWVEPMGESVMTTFVPGESVGRFGERVYSKVRRFIVIRQAENYCTCLPIMSYGKQGVGKPTVKKSEHSIVYTTKDPPEPLPEETPSRGEEGMRPQAIRIDVDNPTHKLDHTSRLDYGKVYTIQHNIKVQSYGKVNPRSMNALVHQFGNVWNSQPVLSQIGVQGSQVDASSAGSGQRRSMQRRESHSARSGPSAGSQMHAGQATNRTQRTDSLLETTESPSTNQVQEYARAAARRLVERGYTEAQAIEAVRAEFRKRSKLSQGAAAGEGGDDNDDDDEAEEDSDDDADDTRNNSQAQSFGVQSGHQIHRSGQSQTGRSDLSSGKGRGKAIATTSDAAAGASHIPVGQPEPSNVIQPQQPYSASLPGSTSSVLSRASPAVVQAMMAEYLKKGYTKEQALKLIEQQLAKKR